MKNSPVEFTPPPETVEEGATEGEAMVRWQKKPNGNICIVEFEGKPLPGYAKAPEGEEVSANEELDSMATE